MSNVKVGMTLRNNITKMEYVVTRVDNQGAELKPVGSCSGHRDVPHHDVCNRFKQVQIVRLRSRAPPTSERRLR